MKTLYLECSMGAAGDMLTAALLELTEDRQSFIDRMNAIGLPGVRIEAEKSVKCGITGTHMKVTVNGAEEETADAEPPHHGHMHEHSPAHKHEEGSDHHPAEQPHHPAHGHHHATAADIESLIDRLDLSERVRADAKAVYALIAEAESKVHGCPVHEIHFHEVGTLVAVADVVGVCLLMETLSPDQVIASPVHTGSGHVHCAHGILPVPAPATALLLQGIPSYGGQVKGELCTPTGAALLKHFVSRFGDRPVMTVRAIGYGMGKKDFEQANCVRAFLGENEGEREKITKLECNLDDMTGEDIGFAMEQLFAAGARDVYTQAAGMKKNRPGVLLTVVCLREDADRLAEVMMKHTTTLGIRRQDLTRYVLRRKTEPVQTAYGEVRIKYARGMGVERAKPEYDDIAALAKEHGVSLNTVRETVRKSCTD